MMNTTDMICLAVIVVLIVLLIYRSRSAHESHKKSKDSYSVTPSGQHFAHNGQHQKSYSNFIQQSSRPEHEIEMNHKMPSSHAEISADPHEELISHHNSQSQGSDYSTYLENQVVDHKMRANHNNWTSDMQKYSGVARSVDNMDEAMEASTHFTGLRRPQSIKQSGNSLFITEVDSKTYAKNPKFNFRG